MSPEKSILQWIITMGSMFVTDWKRESSKYRPFKTWVLADLEPSHFGLLRKIIKDFFFSYVTLNFLLHLSLK